MPGKSWLKGTLWAGALASVGLLAPACSHTSSYAGTGGAGPDESSRFYRPAAPTEVTPPQRSANPYPDLSAQSPVEQGSSAEQRYSVGPGAVNQEGTGGADVDVNPSGVGGSAQAGVGPSGTPLISTGENQPGIGGSGNTTSTAQVNVADPSIEEETGVRTYRGVRPRTGPYIAPWNEPNGSPNAIGGGSGH